MVLNLLLDIVFSVFDFLRGAFLISILTFVLFLLGYFFSKKFLERFNLSWVKKAFISSFFVFVVLLLFVFVWPVIEAFLVVDLGVIPEEFRMTLAEFFYLVFSLLIKMLVVALIFSIFVLPLLFVGVFVFEFLSKKFFWNKFINFFLASFAVTAFGLFIVLFLIPWVIPGAVYLIYFA